MVLGVVWPMACSRQPAASADDDFETRIEHLTDSLMTRPARTDSLLAAFQQELTDSAHWWQAQVFRATARLFRGDTTGALNDYHRVARWTEAHPTAARTAGVLHNHLGVYHLLGGRTAEATTEFEQSYHLLNRPCWPPPSTSPTSTCSKVVCPRPQPSWGSPSCSATPSDSSATGPA